MSLIGFTVEFMYSFLYDAPSFDKINFSLSFAYSRGLYLRDKNKKLNSSRNKQSEHTMRGSIEIRPQVSEL